MGLLPRWLCCCVVHSLVQAQVNNITVVMGVDGQPRKLHLLGTRLSAQDMMEHRDTIAEWCSDLGVGMSTTRCILASTDFVMSYGTDVTQPCHSTAVLECKARMEGSPVPTAPSAKTVAPLDLSSLRMDPRTRLRLTRQRQLRTTNTPDNASFCQMYSALTCSLGTTLIVDLNCADFGSQLGTIASDGKYICVSGSPELRNEHKSFFSQPNKEFILGDVYSPTLFADIRTASSLWVASDVSVIVARLVLEFMSYRAAQNFLLQVRSSGATYFLTSNSVGHSFHNPVSLDAVSAYTRLNLQRYPFQIRPTRVKWRERADLPHDVTEVYDIQRDIPNSYPFYYDEFVCGADDSVTPARPMSALCRTVNTSSPADWALFVHRTQGRVTSQDGQDGTLQYIFQHIGTTNRYFVEFGFNGPTYLHDSGANSNNLYSMGWRGLLLDGHNSNPDINLHATWIDPENIVSVFQKHNVPTELDYLSIDIDSTDLWVFRAIISSNVYRPRVVSVEYNSNYPLESTLCNVGEGYRWKYDRLSGSSLLALKMVGDEFGYSLVDVVSYLDAVFVRTDLLQGSRVPEFSAWRPCVSRHVHNAGERSKDEIEKYIIDYAEWQRNGHDYTKAKGDVVHDQIRRLDIRL